MTAHLTGRSILIALLLVVMCNAFQWSCSQAVVNDPLDHPLEIGISQMVVKHTDGTKQLKLGTEATGCCYSADIFGHDRYTARIMNNDFKLPMEYYESYFRASWNTCREEMAKKRSGGDLMSPVTCDCHLNGFVFQYVFRSNTWGCQ